MAWPKGVSRKAVIDGQAPPAAEVATEEVVSINVSGDGVRGIRMAARQLYMPVEQVVGMVVNVIEGQSQVEKYVSRCKLTSTTGTEHRIYARDLRRLEALVDVHGGTPEALLSAAAQVLAFWFTTAPPDARVFHKSSMFHPPQPRPAA